MRSKRAGVSGTGISILLSASSALATVTPAQSLPALKLKTVVKKNLSGLGVEQWVPGSEPKASAAEIEKLKAQATEYAQYRRGQMTSEQKTAWVNRCLEDPASSLFCEYWMPAARSGSTNASSTQQDDPAEVLEELQEADLGDLKSRGERSLHRAMRSFGSWEPLKKVSQAALEEKECVSSALLVALGQKAEEYFPAPEFREQAAKLYSKAATCAEDEAVSKARFRLSLIKIWDNQCAEAEPHLTRLAEQKNGEFVSRALYWRAQCARQANNEMQAKGYQAQLLKENPLSYHGLLLGKGKSPDLAKALKGQDPEVWFRSQLKPELNSLVRAVESLQSIGAQEVAGELLTQLSNRLEGAEISFRLYVALLLSRSSDTIGQFKVLTGVFRDAPESITRATLELFYPLKNYDVLKRHAAKVDPFLVAALIRQESGFNERARSHVGALGLMQLMPDTARRMERVSHRELMSAKTNVRLGVRYFRGLLDRFDGDAELALAAYNAGPERVDEWKRRYTAPNRMLFFDLIPFKETRDYVALISRNYYWYLSLYLPNSGKVLKVRPAARTASVKPTQKSLVFTLFSSI